MQIIYNNQKMDLKVLISKKEIKERVTTLASQINTEYGKEETLVILMVLHGSLLFTADLVRDLIMPTEIESVRLRSFHGGMVSTGTVELVGTLPEDLAGKNILIVEDIVDSGRSLTFLMDKLHNAGAKSIKIATLLDKPTAHKVDIKPHYVGFTIGPNFVLGYGLDLEGKYRNLAYVAELISAD